MLYQVGLKNFKPFQSQQHFVGKPITLIYGPNSAGKSSIIQSLMLLKQSVEQGRATKNALTPRGEYVDLGSFRSMVHQHDFQREIEISLTFELRPPEKASLSAMFPEGCRLTIQQVVGSGGSKPSEPEGCSLREVSYHLHTKEGQSLLKLHLVPVEQPTDSLGLQPSPGRDERVFAWKSKEDMESFASFCLRLEESISTAFPNSLIRFCAGLGSPQDTTEAALLSVLQHIGVSLEGSLPSRLTALDFQQTQGQENVVLNNIQFRALEALTSEYSQKLKEMSYLGPLRSYPARYYVDTTHTHATVGKQGEHTAQLLYHSPSVCKDRLNQWFERFEIPYHLSFREIGDEVTGSIISLILQDQRTQVSVAPSDVGFGIGQLMPILVEGMASRHKTLCVEQPEIHLHPKLQAHLADFFIETTRAATSQNPNARANQWLIETHSEALMLRLQRRIREGVITPDDVSVLYIQPGKRGSQMIELSLDDDGHFLDEWPDGFFEESYEEIFGGLG